MTAGSDDYVAPVDVVLDGVRVERDRRLVLDIPALRIRAGRTTAILGPNGSGKTTLLRLIAGLEQQRAGRVALGDEPVRRGQPVSYVFQEQVFLRASVRSNLELGLRLRGLNNATIADHVRHAASLLNITHLLNRRADRLSGGEGRRVSLARALCLHAPLVLLDEPLAGLDERTYSTLLDELPELLTAFDATALLVTHSRHEALRLADDLVVLVDGRVHGAGEKHDIVTNPRTCEVADMLGYSVLPTEGGRVAVPPGAFRPGPGRLQFSMVVQDIIDLGDSRQIVGRIDGVRVQMAVRGAEHTLQRGARVLVHAERACELSES
jgi:ABC-type sugar transport system ATPase subunit